MYIWNEFEGEGFVPLIVSNYNDQTVNIDTEISPTDLGGIWRINFRNRDFKSWSFVLTGTIQCSPCSLCGGGDWVGLCKTLTFLQAQPGGASKGKLNTADVIRNSSLAICSSQRLSCHSVPLKWYSLSILILWSEWFVFVQLFNTQPLVGSLLSEI